MQSTAMPNLDRVWAGCDWQLYEAECRLAITDALRHYQQGEKGADGSPLHQVAIYTDPQHAVTCVALETLEHARKRGAFWYRKPDGERVEAYPNPGNAADYRYPRYHSVWNTSIEMILTVDFGVEGNWQEVMGRLARHLEPAVQEVARSGGLSILPTDGTLYVLYNSAEDYCGTVTEYLPQQRVLRPYSVL